MEPTWEEAGMVWAYGLYERTGAEVKGQTHTTLMCKTEQQIKQ